MSQDFELRLGVLVPLIDGPVPFSGIQNFVDGIPLDGPLRVVVDQFLFQFRMIRFC